MKYFLLAILTPLLLASCTPKGREHPDLKGIKVELKTLRFERDLFGIDTANIPAAMQQLSDKYGPFFDDFMEKILGVPPSDSLAQLSIYQFVQDFRPVKEDADLAFTDFSKYHREVEQMLRHVKYYFPAYPLPSQVITFIGPLQAYYENTLGWSSDVITTSGLGIGLQLHLGKDSRFYAQDLGETYPAYMVRRFTPENIVVNCARNIIDDIYPSQTSEKALVDQMVDKGKRLYVIGRFLPDTPDSLLIGYTHRQLQGCYANEGLIWNLFLTNNLLFETDGMKIRPYISESPKTMELGDDSPGYIGLFVGLRIVEKYMEKHPGTTLEQLMQLDERKLFESAKYKPR